MHVYGMSTKKTLVQPPLVHPPVTARVPGPHTSYVPLLDGLPPSYALDYSLVSLFLGNRWKSTTLFLSPFFLAPPTSGLP
jgi:hypothetical protein